MDETNHLEAGTVRCRLADQGNVREAVQHVQGLVRPRHVLDRCLAGTFELFHHRNDEPPGFTVVDQITRLLRELLVTVQLSESRNAPGIGVSHNQGRIQAAPVLQLSLLLGNVTVARRTEEVVRGIHREEVHLAGTLRRSGGGRAVVSAGLGVLDHLGDASDDEEQQQQDYRCSSKPLLIDASRHGKHLLPHTLQRTVGDIFWRNAG